MVTPSIEEYLEWRCWEQIQGLGASPVVEKRRGWKTSHDGVVGSDCYYHLAVLSCEEWCVSRIIQYYGLQIEPQPSLKIIAGFHMA